MASIEIVSGLVLMASVGNISAQDQALAAVQGRCHAEVQQYCAALPAGSISGCLKAHGSHLSATCRSAFSDAQARRSTQTAN